MDESNRRTILKIIFVGDCQVGKTALTRRYSGKDFSNKYVPTVGPKYSVKEVKTTAGHVLLQIWDTSGREDFFSCLGVNFYRDTDCCVLVYDITNKTSFESLNRWRNEFLLQANPRNVATFSFVIIGTKSDLSKSRQITRQEAEQWCRSITDENGSRNVIYIETTAKSSSDVKRVFTTIANHVLAVDQQQDNSPPCSKKEPPASLGCCCTIC